MLAIVGSAGSIAGLKELLAQLPIDFPAPVLIVQHLPPLQFFKSKLDELLSWSSSMQVKWGEEGERLQPGTVYLAPQDKHMTVTAAGLILLLDTPRINGSRPAADPLFFSLALHFGKRAVCVVLSGSLYDGSAGARQISDAGGRVLVQDKESSEVFEMPLAAINNSRVDYVLPLSMIAAALVVLLMAPGAARWFKVSKPLQQTPAIYWKLPECLQS